MKSQSNQAIEALLARSSVRSFTSKKIPSDVLDSILEAAARAPTGGNLQNYTILVSKDEDRIRKLAAIHFGQKMFFNVPVVLTFCADVSRTTRWCELREANPGFKNLWGFLLGMADSLCAAQNTVIAAQSLGLGSCYSGATFVRALPLIDFFKCPSGVIPVATLALGYPASIETSQRPRLQPEAFIHEEQYQQVSDELILKHYEPREALEFEYYRKSLELQGQAVAKVDNLAKIYTELKYRKDDTELFSENYLQALKRQGFLK